MAKNNQYDCIICDLNMPVMDGFECAKKIKEFYIDQILFFNNSKQVLCPYLVACSAFINKEIENKAKEAGFELILESPLTL